MNTLYLELCDYKKTGILSAGDEEKLLRAAEILRHGGLVAFPTETVYGLGGNALLEDASERIYAAKGRPSDNPLIVHISNLSELSALVQRVPVRAKCLAERFWPGPLTMVMEKADCVPYETTGGLDTVAVRMPEHPVARRLIELSGVPVAAPSANTSGRPSPTAAVHVKEDLAGKIEAIVDGGDAGIGVESTIADVSGEEAVLLRPGAVTLEMLKDALGEAVLLDPALERPLDPSVHPKAPGMKYRHYAPKAPMTIVQPEGDLFSEESLRRVFEGICALIDERIGRGERVGVLCSEETYLLYQARYGTMAAEKDAEKAGSIVLRSIGAHAREESIAHNLFCALRDMDAAAVDFIAAEGVGTEALGYAIMNRLKKAAGQNVLYV